MNRSLVGSATACILTLVGCSSASPQPVGPSLAAEEVMSSGIASKALPDTTAQDWVTYGDHLVLVTVTEEFRPPPPEEDVKRGEGIRGRSVMLELDSDVLWSRPTLGKSTPDLPKTLKTLAGAWVFHGDVERRLVGGGDPWMQVGYQYLAIFIFGRDGSTGDEPAGWAMFRAVPLVNGVVTDVADRSPFHAAIVGKKPKEVAKILSETDVDPAAAKYMSEDARDRFVHRQTDVEGSPPAAPGET